ncbi:MAG: hypothetical protein ACJ74Q_15430 [Pyrinomonadaceae bacterium]
MTEEGKGLTSAEPDAAQVCACAALDPVVCKSVRYGHGAAPSYIRVAPCDCSCHDAYSLSTEVVC